jgi:hypothetical protein
MEVLEKQLAEQGGSSNLSMHIFQSDSVFRFSFSFCRIPYLDYVSVSSAASPAVPIENYLFCNLSALDLVRNCFIKSYRLEKLSRKPQEAMSYACDDMTDFLCFRSDPNEIR